MVNRNDADRVMIRYNSRFYFHPGYYIQELMEESGLDWEDFAKTLGTSEKTVSRLIRARQDLTAEMAARLAAMQGTSAQFWLNLQVSYDAALNRLQTKG